jgi:hypothetical protein
MRRLLLTLLTLPALVRAAKPFNATFMHFFPQYDTGLQRIISENCHDILLYYNQAEDLDADDIEGWDISSLIIKGNLTANDLVKGFGYNDPINFLVECILASTPEIIKSKLATSQVLLGLTPSLLALLAPAQHQTGLIAIASGNQLLAALLAAASPTVSPIQSLDYTKAVDLITTRRLEVPAFIRSNNAIVTVIEYIIVFGCIANLVEVSLRFFQQALITVAFDDMYMIFIWFFIGMIIHILGAIAVAKRVKIVPRADSQSRFKHLADFSHHFYIIRRPKSLKRKVVHESFQFYAVSWVASIITVIHIFYGTMVFSSIIFISIEESAIILARLTASTVICKLVIMYELLYLQGVVKAFEEKPGDIQPVSTAANVSSLES